MSNNLQDWLFRSIRIENFRNPGTMQRPMTVDEQKTAGLVATVNRSISGRIVGKVGKP